MRVGRKPRVKCKRSCAGDARTDKTAMQGKKKSRMLEEILNRRNIEKALEQVMRNKGAGGVDVAKETKALYCTKYNYVNAMAT